MRFLWTPAQSVLSSSRLWPWTCTHGLHIGSAAFRATSQHQSHGWHCKPSLAPSTTTATSSGRISKRPLGKSWLSTVELMLIFPTVGLRRLDAAMHLSHRPPCEAV